MPVRMRRVQLRSDHMNNNNEKGGLIKAGVESSGMEACRRHGRPGKTAGQRRGVLGRQLRGHRQRTGVGVTVSIQNSEHQRVRGGVWGAENLRKRRPRWRHRRFWFEPCFGFVKNFGAFTGVHCRFRLFFRGAGAPVEAVHFTGRGESRTGPRLRNFEASPMASAIRQLEMITGSHHGEERERYFGERTNQQPRGMATPANKRTFGESTNQRGASSDVWSGALNRAQWQRRDEIFFEAVKERSDLQDKLRSESIEVTKKDEALKAAKRELEVMRGVVQSLQQQQQMQQIRMEEHSERLSCTSSVGSWRRRRVGFSMRRRRQSRSCRRSKGVKRRRPMRVAARRQHRRTSRTCLHHKAAAADRQKRALPSPRSAAAGSARHGASQAGEAGARGTKVATPPATAREARGLRRPTALRETRKMRRAATATVAAAAAAASTASAATGIA